MDSYRSPGCSFPVDLAVIKDPFYKQFTSVNYSCYNISHGSSGGHSTCNSCSNFGILTAADAAIAITALSAKVASAVAGLSGAAGIIAIVPEAAVATVAVTTKVPLAATETVTAAAVCCSHNNFGTFSSC